MGLKFNNYCEYNTADFKIASHTLQNTDECGFQKMEVSYLF